jgi:hypothetical protein
VIVRTVDTILVTEEQLAEAISLVEKACAEYGVAPEIEVTLYVDPEDETEPPSTCIVAHIREAPNGGRLGPLIAAVGAALRRAGLREPEIALTYHLRPEW